MIFEIRIGDFKLCEFACNVEMYFVNYSRFGGVAQLVRAWDS